MNPPRLLRECAPTLLWFLDFARRERLRVISYEDRAEGMMDGTRFLEVVLRPQVRFASDIAQNVLSQLHERAHEACFIANSVACEVRIELSGSPQEEA